jgi:hypothetical protein
LNGIVKPFNIEHFMEVAMWKGSSVFRIFAALLMVAILVAVGVMIFQAGQSQGYALAAASAGKELAPQVPGQVMPFRAPYGYGYAHFGFWPHFFVFPIGLFLFGLLFFFLIGGFFRRRMWRHSGWGPYGPYGPQDPQSPQNPQGPQTPPAGPGQQPPAAG